MKTTFFFKYFLLLVCSIYFIGCEDESELQSVEEQIKTHPQLQNLQKPDVILNPISKGVFYSDVITLIQKTSISGNNSNWHFKTYENSNRIESITFEDPTYICIESVATFFYKNELIDKIELKSINTCLEFETTKIIQFNYDTDVLMSLFFKGYYKDEKTPEKLMSVGENFFSYNKNGTIAEMFTSIREVYEPLTGYQKLTFTYNDNDNVIETKQEFYGDSRYDAKYSFTYDTNLNPLKGIYFFSSLLVQMPQYSFETALGPIFLSNNCLKSSKRDYLYTQNNADTTIRFENIVENGKVISFGSAPDYARWFKNEIR